MRVLCRRPDSADGKACLYCEQVQWVLDNATYCSCGQTPDPDRGALQGKLKLLPAAAGSCLHRMPSRPTSPVQCQGQCTSAGCGIQGPHILMDIRSPYVKHMQLSMHWLIHAMYCPHCGGLLQYFHV